MTAAAVGLAVSVPLEGARAAPTTWSVSPSHADFTNSELGGVSCVEGIGGMCIEVGAAISPNSDQTVGGADLGPNSRGLIYQVPLESTSGGWIAQAGSWMQSVNPGGMRDTLKAVSCLPAPMLEAPIIRPGGAAPLVTQCVAVGEYSSATGPGEPLIEVGSTGGTWTAVPASGPGTLDNVLTGVSCTGTAFCMAVGFSMDTGSPGQAHTLAMTIDPTGPTVSAALTPPSGESGAFDGVSCVATAASWCAAVGRSGNGASRQALVETYDGSIGSGQWSDATPAGLGAPSELHGVSCAVLTFCAAVGDQVTAGGGLQGPLAVTLQGVSGWGIDTSVITPSGSSSLNTVSCSDSADCLATGSVSPPSPSGPGTVAFAEVWSEGSWAAVSAASGTSNVNGWASLAGVSCGGSDSCWAVGAYNDAQATHALADGFDGATLSLSPTTFPRLPYRESLSGVSCVTPSQCVAVGSDGVEALIDQWDGSNWEPAAVPSEAVGAALAGVSCASATFCMAVGDDITHDSIAFEWTGATWSDTKAMTPDSGGGFSGVSCTGPSFCMAVGGYNRELVEEWDGAWSYDNNKLVNQDSVGLNGVSCVARSADTLCVVVGSQPGSDAQPSEAVVATWTRTPAQASGTWTARTGPVPPNNAGYVLNGVSCVSTGVCEAVGDSSNGESEAVLSSMSNAGADPWTVIGDQTTGGQLNGVSCDASIDCTAVGSDLQAPSHVLVESDTGGVVSWTPSPSPGAATNELDSTSCVSPVWCAAVGLSSDSAVGNLVSTVPLIEIGTAFVPYAPGFSTTTASTTTSTTTAPTTSSTSPPTTGVAQLSSQLPAQISCAPCVGPPGFVTLVKGQGFPPNAHVVLGWTPGLGKRLVATDGQGGFTSPLQVLANDRAGPRQIIAAVFGGPIAEVGFLVNPPNFQPPRWQRG